MFVFGNRRRDTLKLLAAILPAPAATADRKGWITKGDHNETMDSWVVPEWLRGNLVARYRI